MSQQTIDWTGCCDLCGDACGKESLIEVDGELRETFERLCPVCYEAADEHGLLDDEYGD